MNAIVSGQFLKAGHYHSKKQDKDIPQVLILSGDDTITIDNVPPIYAKDMQMGDELEIPVRVYNGNYGLRVVFDNGQ